MHIQTYPTFLSRPLVFFHLFVGAAGAVGGTGLLLTNGLNMPSEWLSSTPFESYRIPGLLLAIFVGGLNMLAAGMIMSEYRFAVEFSFAAGFSLLIWIFTEIYLIQQPHIMQLLFFALGIGILLIAIALIKFFQADEDDKF